MSCGDRHARRGAIAGELRMLRLANLGDQQASAILLFSLPQPFPDCNMLLRQVRGQGNWEVALVMARSMRVNDVAGMSSRSLLSKV